MVPQIRTAHTIAVRTLFASQMDDLNPVYNRHYQQASERIHRICTTLHISVSELLFLSSFLLNFIAGKLLHMFSEHDEVYNYYNDKGNFFNQVFVKRGWGWTTAAIFTFMALQWWKQTQKPTVSGAKLSVSSCLAVLVRWAAATLWWILFTQWCFGLPIMDKLFVHTGGKCASIPKQNVSAFVAKSNGLHSLFERMEDFYESRSITSYKCRKLKGSWEGGHDPSGHVFLLVHSSLFLFHEIQPFWEGWSASAEAVRSICRNPASSALQKMLSIVRAVPNVVVMSLIALWWFMLLVTNMYFHSLAEKLVGLVFGFVGVAALYYAPRWKK